MKRLIVLLLPAALAFGQFQDNQNKDLKCSDRNGDSRRQRFCEVREESIPASTRFMVDAGKNGGISVKGWNRSDVLVRALAYLSQLEALAAIKSLRINKGV